ncbi:HNH endonuclease [Ancylomarina subtilis]|uniref:HNH endonuclease n=1 Tax=Ancylomarina subtilis TaxID=1639035 RepID=A0A4Q7VKD2_9BACT|nr:HNH endonuclease signature motif containing protein [Ancylomarina subtilis]RZT96639.1 HNH endonuclease [Ancylomarina subtilis]
MKIKFTNEELKEKIENDEIRQYRNSVYYFSRDALSYNIKTGLMMKPSINGGGYLKLDLWIDKIRKQEYLHRIVAEIYLGECPEGYLVNHIDFDRTNDNIENLEYVSAEENTIHSIERIVEKRRKITNEQILEFKEYLRENPKKINYKYFMEKFNVCRRTLYNIKTGRTWKHIY